MFLIPWHTHLVPKRYIDIRNQLGCLCVTSFLKGDFTVLIILLELLINGFSFAKFKLLKHTTTLYLFSSGIITPPSNDPAGH